MTDLNIKKRTKKKKKTHGTSPKAGAESVAFSTVRAAEKGGEAKQESKPEENSHPKPDENKTPKPEEHAK